MRILFILATVLSIISCSNSSEERSIPKCIQAEIDLLNSTNTDPDARVFQYWFNDRHVYLFYLMPNTPDGAALVVDENCVEICSLGTIAGIVDCEGINFVENANDEQVIWSN